MNAHCSGSEEQELQNCIWRPSIGKKLSIPLSVSFMFPPKYYFKDSNLTFELYLCMCLSVWNTEAYLASAYITSRYWKTLFNKYSILTLFYILTEPLTILKSAGKCPTVSRSECSIPFYAKVAFSKKYSSSIVFIVTFHKTNRVVPRSQPISRKGKDVEWKSE